MSTVNKITVTTIEFPAVKLVDATKGLYGFFTSEEKREHKRYWDGTDAIQFGDKLNLIVKGLSMFPEGLQFIHSAMFGVSGETRVPDTVPKDLSWTLRFAPMFDCSTEKNVSNAATWNLLAAITLEVMEGNLTVKRSDAERLLSFCVSTELVTEHGETLEVTVLSSEKQFIDYVDGVRTFNAHGIVKIIPSSIKTINNAALEAAGTNTMSTVNKITVTTIEFPAVKLVDATKGLYGFFTSEEKREHKRYWDGTDAIQFGDKLNLKVQGFSMFPDGLRIVHSAMFGVSFEKRVPDTVPKDLSWTLIFAPMFDCSTEKDVSNATTWNLLAAITLEVMEGNLTVNQSGVERLPFCVSTELVTEHGETLEVTVLSSEKQFIDYVDGVRTFNAHGIIKIILPSIKTINNAALEAASRAFGEVLNRFGSTKHLFS